MSKLNSRKLSPTKSMNNLSRRQSPTKGMSCTSRHSSKEKMIYNALKPIVNNYTKLCRKEERQKEIIEEKEKNFKVQFLEEKEFDIDTFIRENLEEDNKCSICISLFEDPLSCYKCTVPFCNTCIKQQLDKHARCPKCYQIVFYELLPKAQKDYTEEYNNKEIKCPYEGCKDTDNLNNIRTHLETCIFKEKRKASTANKIIFQNNKEDPYMKTHMLNYLKTLQKPIFSTNNNNNSKSINLSNTGTGNPVNNKNMNQINSSSEYNFVELDFSPKLTDLKGQLGYVNDYIAKTIIDLAKVTKGTNEKLKTLINS